MLNIDDYMKVAFAPQDNRKIRLESAKDGIDFVVANSQSDEIILYTTAGQACIQSFLVPEMKPTIDDLKSLQYANISSDSTWAIENCYDDEKVDKFYLADPLDSVNCDAVRGGEKLVFLRTFDGVEKTATIEISQRLVHALDLY